MSMARSLWIGNAVVGGGLLLYLLVSNGSASLTETGDEVSRALYLGLWGAVLAAGILGSGLRLSYVARSLALWLIVILALVASYQYRYELQDVASRISAGLIPGSPLSITDSEGRQQVVLESWPTAISAAASRSTGAASTPLSTPAPPPRCCPPRTRAGPASTPPISAIRFRSRPPTAWPAPPRSGSMRSASAAIVRNN